MVFLVMGLKGYLGSGNMAMFGLCISLGQGHFTHERWVSRSSRGKWREGRGGGQKGEVEKKMWGEFGETFAVLLYYFNFSITLGFIILCSVVHT